VPFARSLLGLSRPAAGRVQARRPHRPHRPLLGRVDRLASGRPSRQHLRRFLRQRRVRPQQLDHRRSFPRQFRRIRRIRPLFYAHPGFKNDRRLKISFCTTLITPVWLDA